MIPEPILDAETALRRAVEQQQFSRAQSLALSYSGLADAYLSKLPPGDPVRFELLKSVTGILKWTGFMLSIARAGYSNRLRRILLAKRYLAASNS